MNGKQVATLIISATVIILGVVYLRRTVVQPPAPVDDSQMVALGELFAERLAKCLPSGGKVVTVGLENSADRMVAAEISAFSRAIAKQSAFSLAGDVRYSSTELHIGDPDGGFTGDRFLDIRQKYPQGDIYVSFVGFPDLGPHELNLLGPNPPRIAVAWAAEVGEWRADLINRGVVILVAKPSEEVASSVDSNVTPRDAVRDRFRFVTVENQ
jgi:hypothetical protein